MYCVLMRLGPNEEAMVEGGKGYITVYNSYDDFDEHGELIRNYYDEIEVMAENLDDIIWFDSNGNEYQIENYTIYKNEIYPTIWKRRENER